MFTLIHPTLRPARTTRPLSAVTALTLVLGGCASPPDVAPFALATKDLAAAVRAAGGAVEAEVRRMEDGGSAADLLAKEWKVRSALMDALVRYADGLDAIVASAGKAGAAASELAGEVGVLAEAVGFAPPARAVGVVSDAAAFVWGRIAAAKASASLAEALAAAEPAVATIARRVEADLADLDLAVRGAAQSVEGEIRGDEGFRAANDALRRAERGKDEIFRELARVEDTADLARREKDLAKIAGLDAVIQSARAATESARARLAESKTRERAARALIAAATDATARWGAAHADLAAAVARGRGVNLGALADAVVELRALVRKVREL